MRGEEDGDAGDAETHAEEDEGVAELDGVRGEGCEEAEAEGGGEGDDGVELGLDYGVA